MSKNSFTVFRRVLALVVLALPAGVSAQSDVVVIDIRQPAGVIDATQLRAAIADELGRAGAPGGRRDCRLAVDFPAADQAQVSFTCAGEGVSRIVRLPERPEDATQTIALLAGNLARDEAAELIVELSAPAQAPAEPAVAAQAPGVVTPVPEGELVIEARAEVEVTARLRRIPLSLGFLPPVSTDLFYGGGPIVHGGSANVLAGASAGLDGIAVSGVADVRTRFVDGGQIAGVAAYGGRVRGVQAAGVGSVSGRVRGAQLAGVVTVARSVSGAQVAGAIAAAGRVDGVQMAGALNVAGTVRGAQIGALNIAGDSRGLQLGVVNVAGTPDGIPIGVVSIVKNGPVRFDGWLESSGIAAVALRHGSRRFHNIYAVGTARFEDEQRPLYGLGLGAHATLSSGMDMDIDALAWLIAGQGYLSQQSNLQQLRLTLIANMGGVAVFGGAAANVYVSEHNDGEDLLPRLDKRYDVDGTIVRLWPSLHAGVRFE